MRRAWTISLLGVALLGGCANSREQLAARRAVSMYYVGDFARATEELRPWSRETNENFVLNNLRLGSVALAGRDLDEAETAFLRAYEVLNSFGVNSGGRTMGALLVSESIKVWKGEPFERAMAHFYLGLVYYMRQDYQNARAAFENAIFKLRDYGEAKNGEDRYAEQESDFVIAFVMLGRCWQRLGRDDLARANFERAVSLRASAAGVADFRRNLESNVLLVIDYGYGPQKVTTFDGAIVGFSPKPHEIGPVPRPRVRVDGAAIDLRDIQEAPVDLLALAQERKWQSMDTVRAIKSAVGTGLIAAGAYEGMRRRGDSGTAAALILAGLLLKATSQADVRQWEMLPRSTFLIPLRLPPGRHDVTVEFSGREGYSQTWTGMVAPERGDATYYLRMTRFLSGSYEWGK